MNVQVMVKMDIELAAAVHKRLDELAKKVKDEAQRKHLNVSAVLRLMLAEGAGVLKQNDATLLKALTEDIKWGRPAYKEEQG